MKPFLFFIFGWPGVLLAMLTYGLALASRRAAVAYAAAALSAPFLLYASGYPRIHVMGLAVLAANIAAAVLIARRRAGLAALLLVPYVALTSWIASLVLSQ